MEKVELSQDLINAILNSLLKQESVQLYIVLLQELEKCKANTGS